MSGTRIFDADIDRRCGILFYAAEGESEVPIRIEAAINNRAPDIEKAPFAWPTPLQRRLSLLDPRSVKSFCKHMRRVNDEMQSRFALPLGLIFIDTIGKTAGYKKAGDENDPVIGLQLVNEGLAVIARETQTFVLGVDHFGKATETGTRGASSKEDNVDVVLAALGEKSLSGNITNLRLAVRKCRAGAAGREFPFSTRVVDMGCDPEGRPSTTLAIDWREGSPAAAAARKESWPKSLKILKRALLNVLDDHGVEQRPFADGPVVRAAKVDILRDEFFRTYHADSETDQQRKEAKKKAFQRALRDAHERDLVGIREIDGVDFVWFAKAEPLGDRRP
jgi:hypothetical protein